MAHSLRNALSGTASSAARPGPLRYNSRGGRLLQATIRVLSVRGRRPFLFGAFCLCSGTA